MMELSGAVFLGQHRTMKAAARRAVKTQIVGKTLVFRQAQSCVTRRRIFYFNDADVR